MAIDARNGRRGSGVPAHRRRLVASVRLVVRPVAPLPGVDHPEDEGQHHRRGHQHQPDVHPLAVPLQPRAVVLADVAEGVAHEGAVLQLHQERAVLVQPQAHVHARRHLPEDPRGQPAHRRAHLGSRHRPGLALKAPEDLHSVRADKPLPMLFRVSPKCSDPKVQLTATNYTITWVALSKVTSPRAQVRLLRLGPNGLQSVGISGPDWL